MAEEVQISPNVEPAKIRHPLGPLGLSIITLFIYFFFYWYKVNREMKDLGQARGVDLGQNPTNSVLAIIPGFLLFVPPYVTYWTTCGRIEQAQRTVGIQDAASGPVIFLLLIFVPIFGPYYFQSQLNKVWEAHRSGGAGQLPGQAQQPQAQPAPQSEQPAQQPEQGGQSPPPGPPA
jgi:hypothetical protein